MCVTGYFTHSGGVYVPTLPLDLVPIAILDETSNSLLATGQQALDRPWRKGASNKSTAVGFETQDAGLAVAYSTFVLLKK